MIGLEKLKHDLSIGAVLLYRGEEYVGLLLSPTACTLEYNKFLDLYTATILDNQRLVVAIINFTRWL